jgi:hypothetical protein
MKKKGKAIALITVVVLLVGLTIGSGITTKLPNKLTKEVFIDTDEGQLRMQWVAMTDLWGSGSGSSHQSTSMDGAIDTIGVEAYLYSGDNLEDYGFVMRHNSNAAWDRLYGSNCDFAETWHTFIEGSEEWYPYTCDNG